MKVLSNAYFIIGTAYAGKSSMIRLLAEKYDGILCEENYHDRFFPNPDKEAFPCLCYNRTNPTTHFGVTEPLSHWYSISDSKVVFAFTIVFGVIIAVVSTSACYLFQSFK
jgi:hypothetical protein